MLKIPEIIFKLKGTILSKTLNLEYSVTLKLLLKVLKGLERIVPLNLKIISGVFNIPTYDSRTASKAFPLLKMI